MIKKGKVTQAQRAVDANGQPKSFSNDYGMFYTHFIQFDNGDKGEYSSKSEDQQKFIIGQECEYEFIPNQNAQYPAKIKTVSTGGFSGTNKPQSNEKSFAASYAKDIIIAYINRGDQVKKEWFDDWANHIHNWMSDAKS